MKNIDDIRMEDLPVWRCQEECCGEQWATWEEGAICPFCHIKPGVRTGFTWKDLIEAKEKFGFQEKLPVHIPIPVPELIQLSMLPRETWVGLPVYHPCSQDETGCNWLLYDVGVVVEVCPNPNSRDKAQCRFVISDECCNGTLEYAPSNLWVPRSIAERFI